MNLNKVFWITGYMFGGKTTVARPLSETMGLPVLLSDEYIS